MTKAMVSANMLKNMGKNRQQVEDAMIDAKSFKPLAIKLAIQKVFSAHG